VGQSEAPYSSIAIDLDATGLVDLIDGHQLGFGHRVLGDRHGAGAGVKDAHLHLAIKASSSGFFAFLSLLASAAGHQGQGGGQQGGATDQPQGSAPPKEGSRR
jgi:hypothetical protein